eukprot:3358235-Rhodomonas_salina.2
MEWNAVMDRGNAAMYGEKCCYLWSQYCHLSRQCSHLWINAAIDGGSAAIYADGAAVSGGRDVNLVAAISRSGRAAEVTTLNPRP